MKFNGVLLNLISIFCELNLSCREKGILRNFNIVALYDLDAGSSELDFLEKELVEVTGKEMRKQTFFNFLLES